MTRDEQNLDLLGTLHYVLGGILALFACIPFIHVALGLAIMWGAIDGEAPPRVFGLIFFLVGLTVVLFGWALAIAVVIAGARLRQRRSWTYCMVVAAISTLFMPMGTALGIFTIIVLNKEEVRALFEEKAKREEAD